MIPVELQPEPADFDANVRKPGQAWLLKEQISPTQPLPAAKDLPSYWRRALGQLGDAYSHVCAYFAVRIDTVTGDLTTDHFVAKSRQPWHAYEWVNLRLACLRANRMKGEHDDVLDPVGLEPHTFHLNLSNGAIRPNPDLDMPRKERARKTIARLRLDEERLRRRRAEDFGQYLRAGGDQHAEQDLMRTSPFVWCEAARQDLL